MGSIPGATMVTPSVATPVTMSMTSSNSNAPRTASTERGDSKFLSQVGNIGVLCVLCGAVMHPEFKKMVSVVPWFSRKMEPKLQNTSSMKFVIYDSLKYKINLT